MIVTPNERGGAVVYHPERRVISVSPQAPEILAVLGAVRDRGGPA